MISTSWTQARVEILEASWVAGHTMTQIGRELGVSRNAVSGKVWRLGLGGRQPKRQARKPRPEHRRVPKLRHQALPARGGLVHRSLFELGDRECRWVVDVREFLFCAAPIAGERNPYCQYHLEQSRKYFNSRKNAGMARPRA